MARTIAWKSVTILFLLLLGSGTAFAEDELRQCPNEKCGRYALSDTWNYCPYSGTKLPEVKRAAKAKLPLKEIMIGNMYRNGRYGFQIERPSEKWRFLTKGKGLEDLNGDAAVGLESEDDVYSMVIAERMPGVSLEDFAKLVEPELEGRVLVYRDEVTINGVKAIKLKWSVEGEGIPFRFYYTVVAHGDLRFQIVSWCVAGSDTPSTRVQFAAIENSFRLLSRPKASRKVPVHSTHP